MGFKTHLNSYYRLAKPGIIYANLLTAVAGYLFASQLRIDWPVLGGLVLGIICIISGACAYNNYLDRSIDAAMQRTRQRGLVTGDIKGWQALLFATVLATTGTLVVYISQNDITALLIMIAFIDYVVFYGWAKRRSVHGTLVGTISGAIPLIAGYTAVIGNIDATAVLLFVLMATWQMAHFYGIALLRQEDYAAAGIPVMPVKHGAKMTQRQSWMYMCLFILSVAVLLLRADIGYVTGTILIGLGVYWLVKSLRNRSLISPDIWGKQVFKFSLIIIMAMSGLLAFDSILV